MNDEQELAELRAVAAIFGADPRQLLEAQILTITAQTVERFGCTCGCADRIRTARGKRA